MPSTYERASTELLPIIRMELAKELSSKYKLKQERIATLLGVTQAAVSKYLNDKSSAIKKKADSIRSAINANATAFHAYAGMLAKNDNKNVICELCQKLGNFSCQIYAHRMILQPEA